MCWAYTKFSEDFESTSDTTVETKSPQGFDRKTSHLSALSAWLNYLLRESNDEFRMIEDYREGNDVL